MKVYLKKGTDAVHIHHCIGSLLRIISNKSVKVNQGGSDEV